MKIEKNLKYSCNKIVSLHPCSTSRNLSYIQYVSAKKLNVIRKNVQTDTLSHANGIREKLGVDEERIVTSLMILWKTKRNISIVSVANILGMKQNS